MNGLARLVQRRGALPSGSDRGESDAVQSLRAAGIDVTLEQTAAAVPEELDLLVISAAIKDDHPELVEARRRNVEVVKYAQLLGRLMLGHTGVAVAGTHGKSSTTSMLAHVCIQAGRDPSVIVGAQCAQIGGGWRAPQASRDVSSRGILIAEACEYDRSFHHLHPTHGVILNVEVDHLDLYRDLDEIIEAFATFARRLPSGSPGSPGSPRRHGVGLGSLLIQHESPARMAITAGLTCEVETLGFTPQADWRVAVEGNRVQLLARDETQPVCEWTAPLPGGHMAYNAAAAAVTAHRLGADWTAIGTALTGFQGLDRRMQVIRGRGRDEGTKGRSDEDSASSLRPFVPSSLPVTILDDYGHHPTEIDTTLRAIRSHYEPQRLICVFQPHQHSRTRHLIVQFATSFSAADVVIVPEIYFVRDSEQERQAVTAGHLVDRLRSRGTNAMHLHPFAAIVEQLQVMTRPGDLVVTMGAGDVYKIAHALADLLP